MPLNVFAPAQVRTCVRVMLATTKCRCDINTERGRSRRKLLTAQRRQTAPWTYQPAPSSCPTYRRSASRPLLRRWRRTCSR